MIDILNNNNLFYNNITKEENLIVKLDNKSFDLHKNLIEKTI